MTYWPSYRIERVIPALQDLQMFMLSEWNGVEECEVFSKVIHSGYGIVPELHTDFPLPVFE